LFIFGLKKSPSGGSLAGSLQLLLLFRDIDVIDKPVERLFHGGQDHFGLLYEFLEALTDGQ
jgi:hypothetical protein